MRWWTQGKGARGQLSRPFRTRGQFNILDRTSTVNFSSDPRSHPTPPAPWASADLLPPLTTSSRICHTTLRNHQPVYTKPLVRNKLPANPHLGSKSAYLNVPSFSVQFFIASASSLTFSPPIVVSFGQLVAPTSCVAACVAVVISPFTQKLLVRQKFANELHQGS